MGKEGRHDRLFTYNLQLTFFAYSVDCEGPDKGGYYHEKFLRGKQFLAERIVRTKLKGTRSKKPRASRIEPNFYRWPALPASQPSMPQHDRVQVTPSSMRPPSVDVAPAVPIKEISTRVVSTQVAHASHLSPGKTHQTVSSGPSEAAILDGGRGLSTSTRWNLKVVQLALCLQRMNGVHGVVNHASYSNSIPQTGVSSLGLVTNSTYNDLLRGLLQNPLLQG